MPRKLIPRGCTIFNCDRRHGNYCCYDCGFRTTKGAFRCKNPCQNTPGKYGLDLPTGQRISREKAVEKKKRGKETSP